MLLNKDMVEETVRGYFTANPVDEKTLNKIIESVKSETEIKLFDAIRWQVMKLEDANNLL